MPGPVYDTGLPRAQRTMLRAALAARFADLLKTNGGYLRTITTIPKLIKGEDDLGWIGMRVQGGTPCVIIALGDKKYESVDIDDIYEAEIDVTLYVCSAHARSVLEGRLETDVVAASDATADPGIDTILEHLEERLLGQAFDLGGLESQRTSPMEPQAENEFVTDGEITVWEQKYSVWVPREVNPNRAITQLNTSIETQTSIEPASDPENPFITTVADLETP